MLASIGCAAVTLLFIAPSALAASAGGCQLQGTAHFTPGLNSSSQAFTYNFGGTLSGCQSSESGAPTSGTVAAGQTLTEQVKNSITGATDTVTYQEPVASGSGGGASSATGGRAPTAWADANHTVEPYSTTGALAAASPSGRAV